MSGQDEKRIEWAFRVASRPDVGGGHVSRCLTLAHALAELGDRVCFVVDDSGLAWTKTIAGHGHSCVAASAAVATPISACVLDGYDFDAGEIQSWRTRVRTMVALTDYLPIPEWSDLTFAPAIAPDQVAAGQPTKGKVLTGFEYGLVDRRFVRTSHRNVPKQVGRILMSFGLRDTRNVTSLALEALDLLPEIREFGIKIATAVGSSAPHLSAVQERVGRMPAASCVVDADLACHYEQADLLIGGGGVGLLERMAQRLPSVSVVMSENQRQQIALAAAQGGTLDAGRSEDLDASRLAEIIRPLLLSDGSRSLLSERSGRLIDGMGPHRCALAMWEQVRVH